MWYDLSIGATVDKKLLESIVAKGLSTRKIAAELECSQTNVRYWLRKYELKTCVEIVLSLTHKCPRCGIEKSRDDFYSRRNSKGNSPYCKPCSNDQVLERQRAFKKKCVEYKGGSCERCNYSVCISALEFHHKNPLEKDFGIAKSRSHKLNRVVTDELDKCLILCANCHREEHARLQLS